MNFLESVLMYLSLSCIQLHLIHLIDIMNAVFPYDINYHHIVMYSLSVPHFLMC